MIKVLAASFAAVAVGITIFWGINHKRDTEEVQQIIDQFTHQLPLIAGGKKADSERTINTTITLTNKYSAHCHHILGTDSFYCTVNNMSANTCQNILKANWDVPTAIKTKNCQDNTPMIFTFSPNLDGSGEVCTQDSDCSKCGSCTPYGVCADTCAANNQKCLIDRTDKTAYFNEKGEYKMTCCESAHALGPFCFQRLEYNTLHVDLGCSSEVEGCCKPNEFYAKDACYSCDDPTPRIDSRAHNEQEGSPGSFCPNRVRAGIYSYYKNCPYKNHTLDKKHVCQCPPDKPLQDEQGRCYSCDTAPRMAFVPYSPDKKISTEKANACNRFYTSPYAYQCPTQTIASGNKCIPCSQITPNDLSNRYLCGRCPLTKWVGDSDQEGICQCQDGYHLDDTGRCIQNR